MRCRGRIVKKEWRDGRKRVKQEAFKQMLKGDEERKGRNRMAEGEKVREESKGDGREGKN